VKLAAAWFGFREQTQSNYFEMAAALGLRFVEIPLYWQLIEDRSVRMSSASRAALLETATAAGVRPVSSVSSFDIAGHFDMRGADIDQSHVEFACAAARRAIDIGAELGLEVMRITEPNIPAERLPEARPYMAAYGRAARDLAAHAADRGIRIAIENYGVTAEQMGWVLDEADHPAVGTLFDPCNYFRIGVDPLEAFERLDGRIVYVHLKDAVRGDQVPAERLFPGSRWPPSRAVGEGDIDWSPLLAALTVGYDGYAAIEYEIADDVMRGARASIENVRRFMGRDDLGLRP
jgi:sugar phosphate isomerase/epimerase